MTHKRKIVISESNALTNAAVVTSVSAFVVATVYFDLHGIGLKKTIFFDAFGYLVYPMFYGAMAYAGLEFASNIRHRRQYMVYCDGYISILGHRKIAVRDIRQISIENMFLFRRLRIYDCGSVRINSFMLKSDLHEVAGKIERLIAECRAQVSPATVG